MRQILVLSELLSSNVLKNTSWSEIYLTYKHYLS